MTSPGLLREARALVFVLVCLSLSVTLHGWAHGQLPSVLALLAGTGLIAPVAMVLTGRRRGLPVIAGGLAVTQAGLHGLFTLVPSGVPSGGAHAMMSMPSAGTMLAAHVLAGSLTALWLYAGEVAVWRLVRWFARRVPALGVLFALVARRLLAPAPRRFRPRLAEFAAPPPEPTWLRSTSRRGPPRLLPAPH
ncbi:hypothetical protein [Cryptosporangium phraense]|uniref:Uncharacterized protein n=1 Tax=Cryptosporangium phraense TaxID=2593070 RepID=A0A545ANP3_9ACTN|nr:hypothetical protein [Cryptosporangium phraense]TQS42969.1 hypothetical protein FL583_21240 [Cryptosporangium phraense]